MCLREVSKTAFTKAVFDLCLPVFEEDATVVKTQLMNNIIYIESLKDSDRALFQEYLSESKYSIRMFIHPAAYSFATGTLLTTSNEHKKPIDLLKKIATRQLRKRVPIVVFEDQGEVKWLIRELEQLPLKTKIFVIKTSYDDPEPLIGWDAALTLLKNLGIRRIILCGNYFLLKDKNPLRKEEKTQDRDYKLGGCVVGAALICSEWFEICISHFVNPDNRELYATYYGKFNPIDHKT